MGYEGLTQNDLDNVRALNVAWLKLHRKAKPGGRPLSARRRARLADAPFLLFSLREHDSDWWTGLLDAHRQQDLLTTRPPASGDVQALQLAALAFLWELSRRNAYVARVVSGAPLDWCERIASVTLMHALDCVARCETIEARFAFDSPEWDRLLRGGASALRGARRSAQMAALQSILTSCETGCYRPLAAAACSVSVPVRQVADEL